MHVDDLVGVIGLMAAGVKPGGIVIVEDAHFEAVFTSPPALRMISYMASGIPRQFVGAAAIPTSILVRRRYLKRQVLSAWVSMRHNPRTFEDRSSNCRSCRPR
jgi:hypothetical protein